MVPILKTATVRNYMVLTLHVYSCMKWRVTLSPNTLTLSVAVTTLIGVSREVLFRAVPRLRSRVWRRAVTTTGLVYFVPMHTRPTVAKEPCPEVYMAFR